MPPAKRSAYHGTGTNTRTIPPLVRTAADGPDQSSQLRNALDLAYCQPAVSGFFNFELTDDATLAGWQSGLFWADGTPKPSAQYFAQAAAAVHRNAVDCSQLPSGATGLPPLSTILSAPG